MTRQPVLAILAAGALLGGCATGAVAPRGIRPPPVPIPRSAGTDRVLGASAAMLTAMFGQPQSDVREGDARKLQYGNATCVLDTYLYPRGSGEAVVSYIDARQTDGSPVDRASCVAALNHRTPTGATRLPATRPSR